MPWPTPQDYNEAIQNPQFAFADAELRSGHAELNSLGLPRPRGGQFASVYKMQCGQRNWAVRCFLRDLPDHQQRYAAISEHLNRVRLLYTVGFTFLPQGIRVRGQWYPILKMEWVQGEPLDVYIEKHLGNSTMLFALAGRWVQMTKALQQASIAHGDLQHGNVFVVQGDLRLVDYDGMYVQALSGRASHEVGHRNYQHPQRTELDFGPYVDNFSAWVIYVSLLALSVDPGLWPRFRGGDECLLFHREDFERPEASDALRALEISPDDRVQSLPNIFRSILSLGPRQTPPLDGQALPPPAHTVIVCEGCGQALRVANDRGVGRIRCPTCGWQKDWGPPHQGIPEWLEDHLTHDSTRVSKSAPEKRDEGGRSDTEPDPTWIIEPLIAGAVQTVSFANSLTPERLLVSLSVLVSFLPIPIAQTGIVGSLAMALSILLAAVLNFTFWRWRYRLEPGIAQRANLQSQLGEIDRQIQSVSQVIEEVNREKETGKKHLAEEQARIANDQSALDGKERTEIDEGQDALQSTVSAIDRQRRLLDQEEREALRKIQNEIAVKGADINQRIRDLAQAEGNELASVLRVLQEQYVNAYLRRFTIGAASIPGIGPTFKSRLREAGLQTAADIDVHRVYGVEGIGPSRAAVLATWRKSVKSMARASMPQALSQGETAAIREKYQRQRLSLEEDRDREERRQKAEEGAIRSRYLLWRGLLDQNENAANMKAREGKYRIRGRYDQQRRSLQETQSRLNEDAASKHREINAKIGEARKELFSLRWKKEKLAQELRGFERIRFSNYTKRIFFGSRVT